MELRYLRYFVAVAREQHFTRAAKALGISQPPLSQQIKRLEQEVGTPLLRRLTRGVELTEAGEAFYEDACKILALSDAALEKAWRITEQQYRHAVRGAGCADVRPRQAADRRHGGRGAAHLLRHRLVLWPGVLRRQPALLPVRVENHGQVLHAAQKKPRCQWQQRQQ